MAVKEYLTIERALLNEADKEAKVYAAKRQQKTQSQLNAFLAAQNAVKADKQAAFQADKRAAAQEEAPARRAASVEAAFRRRQVIERMAERGLSRSGVHQAALVGAQEGKRAEESESRAREMATVEALTRALDSAYRTLREKALAKEQALKEAADKDIRTYRTSLEKAARTRAVQLARMA